MSVSEGMQEGVANHIKDKHALQIIPIFHAGALGACSMCKGDCVMTGHAQCSGR